LVWLRSSTMKAAISTVLCFRFGFLASGPCLRVGEGHIGDGTVGMYVGHADIAEWTLKQTEKSPPPVYARKALHSSVEGVTRYVRRCLMHGCTSKRDYALLN
jgi:hypothetical protein